jgi:ketosteroid isomerase-like protein
VANAELVRRVFDAFQRGDFDTALDMVDEDVDWGAPPDMLDTDGVYRGHAGLLEGFGTFMRAWEELRVDVDELTEVGDRVLVMTHWVGRSRGTGIEVDQRIAQVYELRDGKVARVRQFRTREEALARAER